MSNCNTLLLSTCNFGSQDRSDGQYCNYQRRTDSVGGRGLYCLWVMPTTTLVIQVQQSIRCVRVRACLFVCPAD